MLRKVEQTACAVLDMFPDLELAVEEGNSFMIALSRIVDDEISNTGERSPSIQHSLHNHRCDKSVVRNADGANI